MTDSTRRTLRTAFQTLLALLTIVPMILAGLNEVFPADSSVAARVAAIGGSVLIGVTFVTNVVNRLESAGVIPAWLKADPLTPAPVTADGTAVITDVVGAHGAPVAAPTVEDVPPAATEVVDPGPAAPPAP